MNEQAWIDKEIGPRVVGGTYYNGYWGDTYTVEQIYRAPDASSWSMRVRWNDGHTSVHCTAWGATQDNVVATATVPERVPEGMLAVRVGSDPWTMIPLDEETNPVGWDVIDTSTEAAQHADDATWRCAHCGRMVATWGDQPCPECHTLR